VNQDSHSADHERGDVHRSKEIIVSFSEHQRTKGGKTLNLLFYSAFNKN
jgi:hypothetical protein